MTATATPRRRRSFEQFFVLVLGLLVWLMTTGPFSSAHRLEDRESSLTATDFLDHQHQHHHHGQERATREADGLEDSNLRLHDRTSHAHLDNSYKSLLAHSFCGTHDPDREAVIDMENAYQHWKEVHGGRRNLEEAEHVIAVHFHVLACSGYDRLTREHRHDLMAFLNHGFRNSPFEFVMETQRTYFHPRWCNCVDTDDFQWELHNNRTDTLHVYFCNTQSDANTIDGGGHATMPFIVTMNDGERAYTDGIVLMNPSLYLLPHDYVVTSFLHETGHWLGLIHTFGWTWEAEGSGSAFGCTARKNPLGEAFESYSFRGDGVHDTPAHSRPSYLEEGADDCFESLRNPLNTCPDDRPDEVDAGLDPVDNYMNYLPPQCFEKYGKFTRGQKERMLAEYESYRLMDDSLNVADDSDKEEPPAKPDEDTSEDDRNEGPAASSAMKTINLHGSVVVLALPSTFLLMVELIWHS